MYPYIKTLTMYQFRNFPYFTLETHNKSIILTGNNGVGKTSILESISLFTEGNGLRNAPMQIIAHNKTNRFSVTLHVVDSINPFFIEMKWDEEKKRTLLIDGKKQKNHQTLQQYCFFLWITPKSDYFFIDPPETRRKFVDRIISHKNPMHSKYLKQYEKACRSRLFILRNQNIKNNRWLDALERQITSMGLAITGERIFFLEKLKKLPILDPFPPINAFFSDSITESLQKYPASDIELSWQEKLRTNREQDSQTGHISDGPHKSDLKVIHHSSGLDAHFISTGEQKILLLTFILYTAYLFPNAILLLDELTTHLEQKTIDSFLVVLSQLQNQFWITGIQADPYRVLQEKVLFYDITLQNEHPPVQCILNHD